SKQSDENKQNKQSYQNSADLSTLNFDQQKWLSEESHKWDLQDYQLQKNYTEDAIAGFRDYAGKNAASPTGEWQAPPARTDVSDQTAGLAPLDENGNPYVVDPRTGKPRYGAPAATGTVPQFQGAA